MYEASLGHNYSEAELRHLKASRLPESKIYSTVADNLDSLRAPVSEKIEILVQALPRLEHQLGLVRRWYEKGEINQQQYHIISTKLLKYHLFTKR